MPTKRYKASLKAIMATFIAWWRQLSGNNCIKSDNPLNIVFRGLFLSGDDYKKGDSRTKLKGFK